MRRMHIIQAIVVLLIAASSFALCTESLYAKKNKNHKTESTDISADDSSSETDSNGTGDQDETSDDASGNNNPGKTDTAKDDSGGSTPGNTVSGDTVSGDEASDDAVSGNSTHHTRKQKKWLGRVMADTDKFIPVYEKADTSSEIIGRMYQNSVAAVKKIKKNFTKIKSGSVKGYIANDDCIYGLDALSRKKELKKNDERFKITGICTPVMEYTDDEVILLAAIIYCEGGYEIYDGQVAVGAVVMNRVLSDKYPDTIEEVIYQKYQFGPASSGLLEKALQDEPKESCVQAAEDALYGIDPTGGAFFFRRVGYCEGVEIGNHVFF